MQNLDIRNAIKNANLKHWQLADIMNISEATLVRRLRKELSEEEKVKILKLINENKNV